MGSTFFKPLDWGARLGGLFGNNSTIGKAISNDPAGNAIGFENGKGRTGAPVSGQGAYSGQAPTLAASRNFYGTQPNTYGSGGWQG